MTYPNILPVEPGRDGWSVVFNTAASRLLYHCGLRPTRGGDGKIIWNPESVKLVPDWVVSIETRPITVGFTAVRNILRRVGVFYGVKAVADILRTHGHCATLATLRSYNFRQVYVACQAKLNAGPEAAKHLPPPSRKPYA